MSKVRNNHELLNHYRIFIPTFEGEGDGGAGDGGAGEGDPKAGVKDEGGAGGSQVFTQDQVNSMIAKERKTLEEKHKALDSERLKELKMAQSKANLSKTEREDMAKKITQLETKVYSAEELAERERTKLLDEANQAKTQLETERDVWRTRHNEAQIGRDISDAALLADAINPKQIEAILRPTTTVVEEKDAAGNVTLVTQVKVNTTDAEGKAVMLTMNPKKAVETLKENQEFFNLFKGTGTNGLGGGNSGGSPGTVDYKNMSVEEYAKLRKKKK